MGSRLILLALLSSQALAGEEQFVPKEILQACPPPAKIAPYIRACTSNFVAVDWAKSCSLTLDKLTAHANNILQKGFGEEAQKAVGSQSGNFGNTSADLALAQLSFDQLIAAGKLIQANQKAYQNLIAYPGGEDKNIIQALGLTKLYSSFGCVKSCTDAVATEVANTQRKIGELEKGNAAATALWKTSNRRDQLLDGSLTGKLPTQRAPASGAPANLPPSQFSGKQDPNANTITGLNKALEDKRKAEQLLQKKP